MMSCTEMILLYVFIILYVIVNANGLHCDRRPYGASNAATAANGKFTLTVNGVKDTYIPEQLYTVRLGASDDTSTYTSFIISVEGETQPDPQKPRRLMTKYAGLLRPLDSTLSRYSERCHNSLEQASRASKSEIEVYWQAPSSGNGCVMLRAMVAENEEIWYEDGGPLTQRLCEDIRQPDDISPRLNYDCSICDDAKYEVSFSGIWSRNTHPQHYPENDWVPKYSDLVGVSHTADFILWVPGSLASPGLRDLAEHANSSQLEKEIIQKVGDGVRTIIKGKGHDYPNMASTTYAFFRADKDHHLLSTVVSLHPSPDWFLGVTRFELCMEDNTWLTERELNLYPWDAGTDNGVSYESPNDETSPQDSINRIRSSFDKNSPFYEVDMKEMHPFGKLHIQLIRTYNKNCEDTTETTNSDPVIENPQEETPSEPEASRYHTPDITTSGDSGGSETVIDPESSEDCPLTEWEEWLPCNGRCIDGKLNGYQTRIRYHLVDGVAIEKYDPSVKVIRYKEVPKYCKDKYSGFDYRECDENCSSESEIIAARQFNPISPGKPWKSKKRNVADNY